jgi:uncharacterized membrane protein YfcA
MPILSRHHREIQQYTLLWPLYLMELIELSNVAIVFIMAVIIGATVISTVTGMAGGILMFSGMGMFVPMQPLIALHGTVQIFANGSRAWLLRGHLRWAMCLPFGIGAIIGAAATTLFVARYITETLPLLLLLGLIAYSLFRPARLPDLCIADRNFFWVGIATGSLGIVAGAIDPLLAAFFLREDLTKEEVVVNKSFMQLLTHLTKIPAFIYLGFSFQGHWQYILLFSIAGVAGTRLGVYLLHKTGTQLFFRLMRVALFLSGIRILYQLILPLFY